jgi:signal transduction histidine kinase
MKSIFWAGSCSSKASVLKEIVESNFSFGKDPALLRTAQERQNLPLLISEDFELLLKYSQKNPNSHQIYICRSEEFLEHFQAGVRPLNREFFLLDCQTPEEFHHLISEESPLRGYSRRVGHSAGPIPSMKNSLEVLRRITEDRLFEMRNFSLQEEDRRKKFRSLIHLARGLSMSRDIEEVVQYLWTDLRVIEGLTGLCFLITDRTGQCHQIATKSGKFHFGELNALSDAHKEFLAYLLDAHRDDILGQISAHDVESLNFLFKRPLKSPFVCQMTSESSEKFFFLFLETDGHWKKTSTFSEYLQERLSFIHLTLEKHLLQEQIKSKASLWATTFDDLHDPLAIITQRRNTVRANRQFQTLKGQLCHQAWAHSESPCPRCPKTIQESTTFEIQIDQKIYQARLYPIAVNPSTIAQAFIAHYVDVTTERILYSRLIQSEKMIAVGKLAGDLSQALSFPLKKIIQLTEKMLNFPTLSSQSMGDLSEIRRAGHRSLRIIEDFENFSKGRIEKELVMAETIVKKTIPLIKALIHGHRFHLQLADNKHPIMASTSLLQQVLYNLLRNAHQAIQGHGELRISTESLPMDSTEGVCISVLDSGSGIPPELRGKIFQPFVTSKDSTEGTGLGLNIVKQIIESHQGKVGYEPRPEGGSKFWIWLPLFKTKLS